MGSIEGVVETSSRRAGSALRLRDARVSELDEIGQLLGEIYGVFRGHLPPQAWERYIGEILDVRSRLGESELIVAERAGHLIGTIDSTQTRRARRWRGGRNGGRPSARWGCGPMPGGAGWARRSRASACAGRASATRRRSACNASHLPAATRLYERLGFRRAPEFDIEIGEMFTGRSLPAGETWHSQAYRLDLGELK
jgi:hypothetical protein